MYQQILDPIGGSVALSALIAAIPLVLLLVLLGVFRMRSHWAAGLSLLVALLIAVFAFRMPALSALSGTVQGAAFGVFPIVWIIVNAVWVNRLIDTSGLMSVVRQTFTKVSADYRIQALVVAFCFGSVLEAMAGFGAPIVVIAAILMALGFTPIRAATVAMFADSAGTAFGSMGNPIIALSKAANLPVVQLGQMVGRQSSIVAVFVPFVLLLVLDGKRGLRQLWPVGLVAGLAFAVGQFVTSNFLAYPLADLIGALVATAAATALVQVWSPAVPAGISEASGPGAVKAHTGQSPEDYSTDFSLATRLRAFTPYLLLIVLLALVSISNPVAHFADHLSIEFRWPGTGAIGINGKPLTLDTFEFNWLNATGTVLLITGLISIAVLRVPMRTALREYVRAAVQIKRAAITVILVLALAYAMNYSGEAVIIGTWLAGAGGAFVLLSPVLGWLGVAATGSDTSANALFGAVQVAAANHLGMSRFLLAAANSEAGALGKLISPQNLAMAAAAVGMAGREDTLFRRTFPWSVVYLVAFAILLCLMTGPLSWLVVR